jgi:hypothetical protein
MKNSSKTGKTAAKKTSGPSRRMEPVKSKENKNLRFDDEEDDDPEIIEEEDIAFDDLYEDDDDDE